MDHILEPTPSGGQRCTLCRRTWIDYQPQSECPGVPVYSWDPWPKDLYTKAQLNAKGYKPGPLAGVIPREKSPNGWMNLYRVEDAIPKKKPTEKQLAALAKAHAAAEAARHCSNCGQHLWGWRELSWGICERCADETQRQADRIEAAKDAYDLVCEGDFILWDSETTDLDGYFIEVAAVNEHGRVLFNERIAPQALNAPGAYGVHGILETELVGCPTFWDLSSRFREVFHRKRWLIYNVEFDTAVLRREMYRPEFQSYFERYPIRPRDTACVMNMFAQFYGDLHNYWKSYTWQSLDNAASYFDVSVDLPAHNALGDCLRTLGVLYGMAEFYRKECLS